MYIQAYLGVVYRYDWKIKVQRIQTIFTLDSSQNVPTCRSLIIRWARERILKAEFLSGPADVYLTAQQRESRLGKTTSVSWRKNKIIFILHLFGYFSLMFLTAMKDKHVWDVWTILGGDDVQLLCSLKNSKWRIALTANRAHFQMGFSD